MNGWIKLYRKILDNDQLWGSQLTFGLFIYLLLIADQNGVLTTGRFELSRRFRTSPSTIYHTLKRLEKNNQVTLQSNNKYTIVSICNWHKYQHKLTTENTTSEQQKNTLIRIKNKEESNIHSSNYKKFKEKKKQLFS